MVAVPGFLGQPDGIQQQRKRLGIGALGGQRVGQGGTPGGGVLLILDLCAEGSQLLLGGGGFLGAGLAEGAQFIALLLRGFRLFGAGLGGVALLAQRVHRVHMGADDPLNGVVVQLQFPEELAGQ